MKIQQVKNEQIKVGDIVLVGSFYIDSDENLCFTKHHKLLDKEYKWDYGRVYFLTQSKENQKYPKWNYKENNVSYPSYIKKAYSNFKSNAANK